MDYDSKMNPSLGSPQFEAPTINCDAQVTNNLTGLASYLSRLYGNTETSDITLATDNPCREFHVHKLVLSQSPVFQSMLYGRGWQESGASRIVLKETENYVNSLDTFLEYLYGRSIAISWNNVEALVYFGDKYVIDSLLDHCLQFFMAIVEKNGDIVCAFNAWKIACRVLVSQKDRFSTLESLLFSNIELIMTEGSIISIMDEDDVKWFLKSDALVCRTEFTLYKLFESWLLIKDEDARISLFMSLCPYLRLPHMHVQELAYVENSPTRLFPDGSSDNHRTCKTQIKLLLCEAYKFHLIPKQNNDTMSVPLPSPRHYKDAGIFMSYRLKNVNALTSWTKMKDYFDCKPSVSHTDRYNIVSFAVTLMRKINAGKLLSDQEKADKHRSSLLSLEIQQLSAEPLPYSRGSVFVKENRSGTVLLRPLVKFDVNDGIVKTEVKLDDINFDDLLKKSIYQYTDENGASVYLALDIFLHA